MWHHQSGKRRTRPQNQGKRRQLLLLLMTPEFGAKMLPNLRVGPTISFMTNNLLYCRNFLACYDHVVRLLNTSKPKGIIQLCRAPISRLHVCRVFENTLPTTNCNCETSSERARNRYCLQRVVSIGCCVCTVSRSQIHAGDLLQVQCTYVHLSWGEAGLFRL